jgi:two-component system, chemotaxis family, chemotaxis protein CheY
MAKRILVVDDSPTTRQQVATCLIEAGYEVVEAFDGLDALDKREGCAMALCDINMPRMSGLEFLATVAGGSMPVVVLTTEAKAALMTQAKNAGARGWMVKPFKPSQLISVVRHLVG